MDRKAFTERLNAYLQPELFDDYGPNGLQVEGKSDITKVATAVSAHEETIEAAIALGVDALIVHHGLFWRGDAFPLVGAKGRKVARLLECGISLYAYHLPLDAHKEVGNNWKAARDLAWEDLEVFQEIGVRGRVKPQSIEALIEQLEGYYGHGAARALGGGEKIERVALISGGAYRQLGAAAAAGVECFVTGNFDEPAWGVAHEEGVHFLALGHAATERVGPQALGVYIQESLGIPSTFIDTQNPF